MDSVTFICFGECRETLIPIKQALCAAGHSFIGYLRDGATLVRYVRHHLPELLVMDISSGLDALREAIETIDAEMLSVCLLITPHMTSELSGFLKRARSASALVRPFSPDALQQVTGNAILHHRRMMEMAGRLRDMNEKMEARQVIEKAKWMLVARENISEAEAYERIRKRSRDRRVQMKDVAEAILIAFG